MRAYSPTGSLIVGTLERIPGVADIHTDSFARTDQGVVTFEFGGETDVDWDGQETICRPGKDGKSYVVYVDAVGDEWTEDQITLKDEP
jgi:hypothetical protein